MSGGLGLGGGSSGAKFVLNFSIEGSGIADLDKIASKFKQIGDLGKGSGGGGEKAGLGGLSGMAFDFNQIVDMGEKVMDIGHGMIDVGVGVLEAWGKAFEVLIDQGKEFENILLGMRGTGKTKGEAIQMMEDALAITRELPITEMDAAKMVQTFASIHIDALEQVGESYAELEKKGKTLKGLGDIMGAERMAKEGPKAVTIMTDMLSAMGHLGTGYQQRAQMQLLQTLETGKIMSRKVFAALGGDVDFLKEKLKSAHTPAERLLAFQETLSKRGALGISQAAMGTFSGVMTLFKGVIQQFSMAILQPGKEEGLLGKLTKGMKELYDIVSKFFDTNNPEGKKFLQMLRDVFGLVGGVLLKGMQILGSVVEKVFSFMANNTYLMKFIAISSLVVSAFLIIGGAALMLAGTFIAVLGAAMALAPVLLILIPAAVGIVMASFVGLGAALALAALAYKAWESDFAGVRSFFTDVTTVVDALKEAFQALSEDGIGEISEETYQKLESKGLTKAFLSIGNIILQLKTFWKGFMEQLTTNWEIAKNKFSNAWDKLSETFGRIWVAIRGVLGAIFDVYGSGADAVDEAGKKGEKWGNIIGDVLISISNLAEKAADWVDGVVADLPTLINMFAELWVTIRKIQATLVFVGEVVAATFKAMMILLEPVVNTIIYMFKMLVSSLQLIGVLSAKGGKGSEKGFSSAMANFSDSFAKAEKEGENIKGRSRTLIAEYEWSRDMEKQRKESPTPTAQETPAQALAAGKPKAGALPAAPVKLHGTINNVIHLDGRALHQGLKPYALEDAERGGNHPTG